MSELARMDAEAKLEAHSEVFEELAPQVSIANYIRAAVDPKGRLELANMVEDTDRVGDSGRTFCIPMRWPNLAMKRLAFTFAASLLLAGNAGADNPADAYWGEASSFDYEFGYFEGWIYPMFVARKYPNPIWPKQPTPTLEYAFEAQALCRTQTFKYMGNGFGSPWHNYINYLEAKGADLDKSKSMFLASKRIKRFIEGCLAAWAQNPPYLFQ